MAGKNNCVSRTSSRILCRIFIVITCVAPCIRADEGDVVVPSGKEWDIDYTVDGFLFVYGNVNLWPGTSVYDLIVAFPGEQENQLGAVVNIYGCEPDNWLWVLSPSEEFLGLPPIVTVYGPKFRVGLTEYSPSEDVVISGLLEVLSEIDEVLFSLTIFGDVEIHLRVQVDEIAIDIKPDGHPNSINLGSKGLVPVAIFSTPDFDATTIPADTIFLAGAGVATKGKDKYMAHEEDVDGDGLLDLVVQVETKNLDPDQFEDGWACLQIYETSDKENLLYEGWDEVRIVPSKK